MAPDVDNHGGVETREDGLVTHYRREYRLPSALHSAYRAVSTQEGVAGWWTEKCKLIGSTLHVEFGEVTESFDVMADGQQQTQWHCTQMYWPDPALARTDEWVGTTIVFKFERLNSLWTNLSFEHRGLTPQLDCWSMCERGWSHYLASLDAYLRCGHGFPYRYE